MDNMSSPTLHTSDHFWHAFQSHQPLQNCLKPNSLPESSHNNNNNNNLDPSQFQVAIKWWLGLDLSYGSCCPLCPEIALDPLGHHAVTCKRGGDVVSRHNKLRDVLAESCRRAHLGVQVEMGNNLTNHSHTRPADLLVPN